MVYMKNSSTEENRPMTLFVRDLTAIDSSYLCTQRGLVGETWLVDLQLQGKLDSMSMVWDFGQIKKRSRL